MKTRVLLLITPGRVLRLWAFVAAASLLLLGVHGVLPAWQHARDPHTDVDEAVENAVGRYRNTLRRFVEARRVLAAGAVTAWDARNPLERASAAIAEAGASLANAGDPECAGRRLWRAGLRVRGSYAAVAGALVGIENIQTVRLADIVIRAAGPGLGVDATVDIVWLGPPEVKP